MSDDFLQQAHSDACTAVALQGCGTCLACWPTQVMGTARLLFATRVAPEHINNVDWAWHVCQLAEHLLPQDLHNVWVEDGHCPWAIKHTVNERRETMLFSTRQSCRSLRQTHLG